MKNPRTRIGDWFNKLNGQWRAMPVKKQHRYMLLFFLGYALLSVVVLLKVCYDIAHSDNTMAIEHIENPINRQNNSSVSPQDSIKTILKGKNYERE